MPRDLGTYWVRVEYADGRGHLQKWSTGARYTHGTESWKPLDASRVAPVWDDEADIEHGIVLIFTEGNYSCDCNRLLFLDNAAQIESGAPHPCGETMTLKRLTMIRPDGSEKVLYDA